MYNGIGLRTVRGSGTNGYVQRNLSLVRNFKPAIQVRKEYEAQMAAIAKPRVRAGPNPEILEHQRKRQVEVRVMEWAEEEGLFDSEYAFPFYSYLLFTAYLRRRFKNEYRKSESNY